ncbi:hypothetical protein XELAEV_18012033mg [Xenopus laevis]|uniref:Uncharacterized protein n=1 Tax=Xenopus laevis TaxID=8355 RepID=A0A974DPK7_XENLA|nr:hypothetical protein XELAEV_18012033mg [Xenopus laevis]
MVSSLRDLTQTPESSEPWQENQQGCRALLASEGWVDFGEHCPISYSQHAWQLKRFMNDLLSSIVAILLNRAAIRGA